MKKSVSVLLLAAVLGLGSAFTSSTDELQPANLAVDSETPSCVEVQSGCNGNGNICSAYRKLDQCTTIARQP